MTHKQCEPVFRFCLLFPFRWEEVYNVTDTHHGDTSLPLVSLLVRDTITRSTSVTPHAPPLRTSSVDGGGHKISGKDQGKVKRMLWYLSVLPLTSSNKKYTPGTVVSLTPKMSTNTFPSRNARSHGVRESPEVLGSVYRCPSARVTLTQDVCVNTRKPL